jgi:hypothetical protein
VATVESAPTAPKELSLKERIGATSPDGSVKWINAIIYGEPGAGKTYFFGTAEDDPENFLPALAIDIDGGVEDTLRNRYKIDRKAVRTMEELQKLYREIAAEPDYYKTISLDNITELQKLDMNAVMMEAKANSNNPDNVDIYVPSMREWGKSGERMRIIIRAFRDLPCHTIAIAHVEEKEDKLTKVPRLWPSMPGKLRHELSGFFSVVGYLSTYEAEGSVYRQIQFAKTKRVQAKDRFGVLPDIMTENPTLPQVFKVIRDSGATINQDDPLQAVERGSASTIDTLKGAINS